MGVGVYACKSVVACMLLLCFIIVINCAIYHNDKLYFFSPMNSQQGKGVCLLNHFLESSFKKSQILDLVFFLFFFLNQN